jgi:hypothetical protein
MVAIGKMCDDPVAAPVEAVQPAIEVDMAGETALQDFAQSLAMDAKIGRYRRTSGPTLWRIDRHRFHAGANEPGLGIGTGWGPGAADREGRQAGSARAQFVRPRRFASDSLACELRRHGRARICRTESRPASSPCARHSSNDIEPEYNENRPMILSSAWNGASRVSDGDAERLDAPQGTFRHR